MMHPIDSILQEFNITRYKLSKDFNLSQSRLRMIATRNAPVDTIQVEIIHAMSVCFGISMDEVYSKLKKYEATM